MARNLTRLLIPQCNVSADSRLCGQYLAAFWSDQKTFGQHIGRLWENKLHQVFSSPMIVPGCLLDDPRFIPFTTSCQFWWPFSSLLCENGQCNTQRVFCSRNHKPCCQPILTRSNLTNVWADQFYSWLGQINNIAAHCLFSKTNDRLNRLRPRVSCIILCCSQKLCIFFRRLLSLSLIFYWHVISRFSRKLN